MEIDGIVHPTVKGVPQGGVVSPLLANVVLNKLDWFLHSKGFYGGTANLRRSSHNLPNVRFARYADDWCVFLTRCNRQRAERLRDEIRDFLRETCGLELSAEKTRITHVRDGYDFLGFNISTGVGRSGTVVPKVKVGRKAIANIQTRLGEVLRYRPMQESISVRLERASAVIRGWSNYFKIAHNFSQSCPWAGPQGFLDRGESDMQEGRHIDCQMPPQVRSSQHHWGSRRLYAGPLPGYGIDVLLCRRRNRINLAVNQPYPEDDEWEAAFVLPRPSTARRRRPQVEGSGPRRLLLPWLRGRGYLQDLACGPY